MTTFDEWIAALESGRYNKGQGRLRSTGNAFCCLGVLADLDGCEWRKRLDGSYSVVEPDGESAVVYIGSGEIRDFLTFRTSLTAPGHIESFTTTGRVTNLNDDSQTFAPVVEFLKERWHAWKSALNNNTEGPRR